MNRRKDFHDLDGKRFKPAASASAASHGPADGQVRRVA
jgi:hypothetical protein